MHSLFLFISPEKTKLGLFQRAHLKYILKQHLTLPPKLFPLLSTAAPLFPFVETKEKIL